MEILYQDKDIIVCIKPRGLLSQYDEKRENMISEIMAQCGGEVYPVHRLDREVGGAMVYARTSRAAGALSAQVADRSFEKEYLALVNGEPTENSGVFEDLLFFDKSKNKSFVVKKERRGVKKASLSYEVLEIRGESSLVKVRLHTGRTHQIRVQFASRKMPLAGDRRYGSRDESRLLGLWSYRISFSHPEDGRTMEFTCPADF